MTHHRPKENPKKLHYPDIPYENHKQTKEIIRLELNRIAISIQQGFPISDIRSILRETQKQVDKLEDRDLSRAFNTLSYVIENNWPLNQKSAWDVLESVGRIFAYLDEKTVY